MYEEDDIAERLEQVIRQRVALGKVQDGHAGKMAIDAGAAQRRPRARLTI